MTEHNAPKELLCLLTNQDLEALARLLYAIPFRLVALQARNPQEATAMVDGVTKLSWAVDRALKGEGVIEGEVTAARIAALEADLSYHRDQLALHRKGVFEIAQGPLVANLQAQLEFLREGLAMCAQGEGREAQRIAADVLAGHEYALRGRPGTH